MHEKTAIEGGPDVNRAVTKFESRTDFLVRFGLQNVTLDKALYALPNHDAGPPQLFVQRAHLKGNEEAQHKN